MTHAVFAATVMHIAGEVMVEITSERAESGAKDTTVAKTFASRFWYRRKCNVPDYLPRLIMM